MPKTNCIYCDNPNPLEGERVLNMGQKVSKHIMTLCCSGLGLLHGVTFGGSFGKALFNTEVAAIEKLYGMGIYHFYCPMCKQDFIKKIPIN